MHRQAQDMLCQQVTPTEADTTSVCIWYFIYNTRGGDEIGSHYSEVDTPTHIHTEQS